MRATGLGAIYGLPGVPSGSVGAVRAGGAVQDLRASATTPAMGPPIGVLPVKVTDHRAITRPRN